MSAILDKLLKGRKVEFKQLWEVTVWDKRFNAVENHKQPKVDKYYYFLASDLKSLAVEKGEIKLLTTNISDLWTTEELVGDKVKEGEIIAIPWGGNPVVQYYKGKFVTADNRIATSNNTKYLDNKYLYYFLLNKIDLISSFYRGSGIKHPSMADVLNLEIPIPPLDVQAEIVRILDAFTAVTAELTAELNMREKQYQYYRDKLLTFSDNEVEWKTLGNIALKISSGGTPKTGVAEYYDGNIPWLRTQEVNFGEIWETDIKITELGLKNSSARMIPANCVIVAMYGATVGKVGINKIPMATNQACANIQVNEKLANYRYVFHVLKSKYQYIKSLGTGSQTNINAQIVKNLEIPIPTLNEQKRIANILDKFEALTHSITEGLPKEINLRQRQYEYYREQLLDFPRN